MRSEASTVKEYINGLPEERRKAIKAVRAMPAWQVNPKPIVINEDSPAVPNLDAAWRNGCSWG